MNVEIVESPRPKSKFPVMWVVFGALVVLLALLVIPAMLAAQEAARRMQASNNVKQIGLALHNYHDVSNSFPPPTTYNTEGEPAYSWRLAIVPYMEATSLYNEYDRDGRWDNKANMDLCSFAMPFYQRKGAQNQHKFATNFVFVTGPGTLFPPEGPKTLADVKDAPHDTIMVVEIDNSDIPWYEPRDLDIEKMSFEISDPDRSKPSIGNRSARGAIVGMVDGSVRFLPQGTSPETVRAMLTIAGGEDVQLAE